MMHILLLKSRYLGKRERLNGMVVPDSDPEDPEEYIGVQEVSMANHGIQNIVTKRLKAICRHARYLKCKKVAERKFLSKKTSGRVSGILKNCPDIGKVRNIGADAWRRTGVMTFNGNTTVGKKVTFQRIREFLQTHYHRKFSYGSVVQLCVARNKVKVCPMLSRSSQRNVQKSPQGF